MVVSEVIVVGPGESPPMSWSWSYQRSFGSAGGTWGTGEVHVRPARMAKCPRCWRYLAHAKKEEAEEDSLCGRCEEVVAVSKKDENDDEGGRSGGGVADALTLGVAGAISSLF